MVAKDLNEVNAFLDNLPTAPCHIKRPEALCSLCEKLNNDVYRACQERDRDENGMLLDVGDFTDVGTASEDTGAPAKEEAEEPQALVRKVSDTVAIEFLRPSTPPEPEARGPEVPTPPAMPPKPAPPESPSAPPAGPVEATPPDLDSMAPKERAPLPEEKIEVRDKTTGLSIEFVPKKKHFKAKPKDTLWEEIMSEALFRGIVDEFVPPTEPEAAETPSEATEAPAGPGEAPDAGVEMPAPAPAEAPIGDISTTVGTGVEAEPIEVVVVEIETVEAGGEAGEVLEPEILEVEVLVEEEVPTTPVLGSGFEVQMQQVREGRYEEALAGFEAVLAGDPDNVDARVGRGHVLRLLSRYEEALAAFDSVLAIDPGRADAAAEREKVLEHMKMTDFAQVKDRADSLFKEGQYDDALVLYDRAIELSTNDIHVLNNKALTLRALQRFEEAREVYEEILGIDPENLKARKGLERTNLAIAELREGTTVAPVTPESLDVTAPAPEVEGAPAEAAPKAPVRAKKVRINRERAEEFRRKRAAEAREGTEAGTPPTEAPGETAGPGAEA
ncbi:MAG TPA: tetratricopeptide repeat protein, partial [Thermoplasmata archaeon]|nr:tetratricopeptide repeat protein [Thermoplasmata archaeon]